MAAEPFNIEGMTEMIDVFVGSGKACWKIHKNLLINNSAMAKAALLGGFKEATENKITWPELDDGGFRAFVSYLYTERVPEDLSESSLVRAYVVGDQLSNTTFLNLVFEAIIKSVSRPNSRPEKRVISTFLSSDSVEYIMENTNADSPLHRFCVDLVGAGVLRGHYRLSKQRGTQQATYLLDRPLPDEHRSEFLDGVVRAVEASNYRGKVTKFNQDDYLPHVPHSPTQISAEDEVDEDEGEDWGED